MIQLRNMLLLTLIVLATACKKQDPATPINYKIGVIGDSIARGTSAARLSTQLDPLLPAAYEVANYAVSGTCVVKECFAPIWETAEFENIQKDEPGIIVIMIGTNDAHHENRFVMPHFNKDYREMVELFLAIPSKPRLVLCYPPPFYQNAPEREPLIRQELIPIIDRIAADYGLDVADTHFKVTDYPENYPDGLHPDKAGLNTLAGIVAGVLGL